MKKLEFETSKGRFLLIDQEPCGKVILPSCSHIEIGRLKQITEEQASDIVDLFNLYPKNHYQDYERLECGYSSSIISLHSLLRSKGIYLFKNPYPDAGLIPSAGQQLYREAELKTFYNPVIFKL